MVDDAVLESEGAEPVRLLARFINPVEVVLGAVCLLVLRKGDAEVESRSLKWSAGVGPP